MVSREVNVNRPEHSWIPFYRELAEKLVNDGWREKQGELVGMLKDMGATGLPVPKPLRELPVEHIDPFTFFASFNAKMKTSNRAEIIFALGRRFGIEVDLKNVVFYVPDVRPDNAIFFNWEKQSDYVKRIGRHWDTFEYALNADPLDNTFDDSVFVKLIDRSLGVTGVDISKLSSAFYWINPVHCLHSDTINGILDVNALKYGAKGDAYLNSLRSARSADHRSFPVINDEIYLRDREATPLSNVWIVRGGTRREAVSVFLSENRVGIGFQLDGVDLSKIKTHRRIRRIHMNANPGMFNMRANAEIEQTGDFLVNINVGDYVIMPAFDELHFGMVTSAPYYDADLDYSNSRAIRWSVETIRRSEFGNLDGVGTVGGLDDDDADRFYGLAGLSTGDDGDPLDQRLLHPDDSWVPFHLEVKKRLIEGEWWESEKREIFGSLLAQIIAAAGVTDEQTWTPDPYSLFLAFNTARLDRDREAGYDKVRELFEIAVSLPERGHYARSYGVHYWSEMRLERTGVNFLWDFFRFLCDADPANDSDDEEEFVRRFDTALSNDVPGMASATLSQWLYWINPTKYLLARRIHASELGLAAHLGLTEPIEGGAKYVEALKAVDEFSKSKGMTMLDINRDSTTREMLGLGDSADTSRETYDVSTMLNEHVFLKETEINRMLRILRSKKNLILQGPPGVGKTFIARKLAYVLMGEKGEGAEKRITSVQFHQSYSYEDFVGGFRPDVADGQMVFARQDGPFLRMCTEARANPDDDYVMLIDEINRGNLSRVFGELLMLIEADKRRSEYGVTLQHRPDAKERFFVPDNVYIIGTMNLADRSLTGMNVAMRRRFGFVDLEPQFNERVFTDWLSDETDMPPDMQARINTRMAALNSAIADDASLGFNYAVGHSFFCPPEAGPAGGWKEWYETVVEYEIRPLLREYWFDAPDTANGHADKLLESD